MAGRLASVSEAMNPPQAQLGKEGVWRRKGPKKWGQFSHLRAPPSNPVPAYTPICVSPSSADGKPGNGCPKGYCFSIRSLPPLSLSPASLLSEGWEGKMGLRKKPSLGWYDLFSRVSNQCICLSASSPHRSRHHHHQHPPSPAPQSSVY